MAVNSRANILPWASAITPRVISVPIRKIEALLATTLSPDHLHYLHNSSQGQQSVGDVDHYLDPQIVMRSIGGLLAGGVNGDIVDVPPFSEGLHRIDNLTGG